MPAFLTGPWPWYVSGVLIGFSMLLIVLMGKTFGISSNFRTICSIGGAGRKVEFFNINWKDGVWNIYFIIGTVIGGWLCATFLASPEPVAISAQTVEDLSKLGIAAPHGLQPEELYSPQAMLHLRGFLMIAIGGLFVGWGTTYARGCTSGHAISGLANLQWPSLVAVIGFFIGGLVMTHLVFPFIFW